MAFDGRHGLGLCDLTNYVAQSHTPQAHCVRFGRAVTGRTRNTRYQAARYALPGRDLPPLDRAGFIPAHAGFIGIGSLDSSAGTMTLATSVIEDKTRFVPES
jgi:hypothetical protein